jgi:Leucine-rich repeat (LRR) protein
MDLDLTPCHVRFQVGDNQLTSLPAEIGQLTQLEWLSCEIRIEWIVI